METETFKYWAFISYSHRDDQARWWQRPWRRAWGKWLHRSLESYRIPANLVGTPSPFGPIPKRLLPIFRDRDELPSSANLQDSVREALEKSRTLIVICSPDSARSQWVEEEIVTFKRLNRSNRILALIIDGEPNTEDKPGVPGQQECFGKALRHEWADGQLSSRRAEPVAADARRVGDGQRDAFLKIVAGVLGVSFDMLKQRELQRRNRRLAWISTAGFALSLVIGMLAAAAWLGWGRANQLAIKNKDLAIQERELRLDAQFRLAEAERDKGLQLCAQGDVDQGCLWLAHSLATAPANATDLRWSIRINLAAWQRELCTLKGIFSGEGNAPRFSRDSLRFATSGIAPPAARVRDTATGKLLTPPMPHERYNVQLLYGADNHTFLIKSAHDRLSLWREVGGAWKEHAQSKADIYHITDENRVLTGEWRVTGYVLKDALTNEQIGKMLPTASPGNLIISPNGQLALTLSKKDRLVLTNLVTGEPIGSPLVHPGRVTTVSGAIAAAFSPDSRRLVASFEVDQGEGRTVYRAQVWDTATAAKIGPPLRHEEARLESFAFGKSGDRLFTATRYKLRVWDRAGNLLAGPLAHAGAFSVSDNGHLLAYVGPGREVRLWDVDAQQTIAQPLARRRSAHFLSDLPNVALAPDGKHVLTGTPEEGRLWEAPQRGQLSPPLTHGNVDPEILWLDFSRDSKRLLSASYAEMTARVWDVSRQKSVGTPKTAPYGIQCRTISPEGRWAAIGSMQGANHSKLKSVYLWNVETGEAPAQNLPEYDEITHWLAFSHDGKLLVTAGDRGKLHVYNMERDEIQAGPFLHPMSDIEGQHVLFAISPDDQRIAVFSLYDSTASLWNLQTGQSICEPLQLPGRILELTFSPDGKKLAVVGEQLRLFDAERGAPLPVTFAPTVKATDAAFSPDGELLAAVQEDRTVRIWQTSTGKLSGRPLLHAEQPRQVAFAAEGKLLLTSTNQGAYLWDLTSGTQVGPVLGSSGNFVVSPNGRTIAAAAGPAIRLWDVPRPVADDAAAIMRQIEATTALALDEDRLIQPLTARQWQAFPDAP